VRAGHQFFIGAERQRHLEGGGEGCGAGDAARANRGQHGVRRGAQAGGEIAGDAAGAEDAPADDACHGCSPIPKWSFNAATTSAWSSTPGRPEAVTVPTAPPPRMTIG